MIDFLGCCCLLNANIFAGDRVNNVSSNLQNRLRRSWKLDASCLRLSLIAMAIMVFSVSHAQECIHEVTLNDRYMGSVACYFPNEGNATDAFMELGLFAREFAAHSQIDDSNNVVYLRRGRQSIRLMTTADIATGLQRSAGAIDYNGQSVESFLGIKSNGIVYVPLTGLVNLFLGSSSFEAATEATPARYSISTFADNNFGTSTQGPVAETAVANLNQTQAQVQQQINAQVDAIANTDATPVGTGQNQLGQVAQTPANAAINASTELPTQTQNVAQVPANQAQLAQPAQPAAQEVLQNTAQNTAQNTLQNTVENTAQTSEIVRIAKPRIGQHDTYTRVAIDLPVGSGYEISVKGNTFVVLLPNMEALGFEYSNNDRFIKDIGYRLIENTLALVVTTHYLMSSDGFGYRIGTLPPSATRAEEVLYVDFGEEITSSAPVSSPYYAAAMQLHSNLSPNALQQLQTLLQVSNQNAQLGFTGSALPAEVDYSQELVPDGVQTQSVQAQSAQALSQPILTSTQDMAGQMPVQANIQDQAVQDQAVQGQAIQSQAIQGIMQSPVATAGTSTELTVGTQAEVQTDTAQVIQAPLAPLSNDATLAATATQAVQQATAVEVLPVATQAVAAPDNNAILAAQRSAGFSVVIDPGHGGVDPGANGIVVEEEVVLDVSLRLKDLLERYGIEVIMTREDDSSLKSSKRADLAARAAQATVERNLFVSIHANAAKNQDAHGVETWVFGKPLNDTLLQNAINENGGGKVGVELTQEMQASFSAALLDIVSEEQLRFSKILAESIQSQMVAKTGARDRGIKENYFYVIRNAQSPAVLVEIGFVNHPEEGELLATDEYRDKLAEGLFDGIMGFFSVGEASTSDGMANQ